MKNDFTIDIQMSDAGNLITAEKYRSCFVTKYVVNQQHVVISNRLQPWLCEEHMKFPEHSIVASLDGLIVCRIRCCCENQLQNVDTHFHGEEEVK